MQPAAAVQLSDLGSYQSAVRLVLTHDVITATRPRPGSLETVLRWADQLAKDLRDVLGYTLIATTRQVRPLLRPPPPRLPLPLPRLLLPVAR